MKELETNITALSHTDIEPRQKELSLLQLEIDKHHQDLAHKKEELDSEKQSFYQKQQSSVGRGVPQKPVTTTASDKKTSARDSNVLNWYLKGSSPTSSSGKDNSLENLVAYKKEVPKKDTGKGQKSNDKAAATPVTATTAAPAAHAQVTKPFSEEIAACEKMIKYLKKFNKPSKKAKKLAKTEVTEDENDEQTVVTESEQNEETKVGDVAINHNFDMLVLFERLSLIVPTSGSQIESSLQSAQARLVSVTRNAKNRYRIDQPSQEYFRKLSTKRSPVSEIKEENNHAEQQNGETQKDEERKQEEADKQRQEAEKQRQEEDRKKQEEERQRQEAEQKRSEQEAEQKRQEELKKREEEERLEAEKKRQEEEAEKQTQETEAAEKKFKEDRKKQEEERLEVDKNSSEVVANAPNFKFLFGECYSGIEI